MKNGGSTKPFWNLKYDGLTSSAVVNARVPGHTEHAESGQCHMAYIHSCASFAPSTSFGRKTRWCAALHTMPHQPSVVEANPAGDFSQSSQNAKSATRVFELVALGECQEVVCEVETTVCQGPVRFSFNGTNVPFIGLDVFDPKFASIGATVFHL